MDARDAFAAECSPHSNPSDTGYGQAGICSVLVRLFHRSTPDNDHYGSAGRVMFLRRELFVGYDECGISAPKALFQGGVNNCESTLYASHCCDVAQLSNEDCETNNICS